MANFAPIPQGSDISDRWVHCTQEKCVGKTPVITYKDRYQVTRPTTEYNGYRVEVSERVFYCGHCNNVIAKSQIPTDTDVVGMPKKKV